jgi:hypothetical protein
MMARTAAKSSSNDGGSQGVTSRMSDRRPKVSDGSCKGAREGSEKGRPTKGWRCGAVAVPSVVLVEAPTAVAVAMVLVVHARGYSRGCTYSGAYGGAHDGSREW